MRVAAAGEPADLREIEIAEEAQLDAEGGVGMLRMQIEPRVLEQLQRTAGEVPGVFTVAARGGARMVRNSRAGTRRRLADPCYPYLESGGGHGAGGRRLRGMHARL